MNQQPEPDAKTQESDEVSQPDLPQELLPEPAKSDGAGYDTPAAPAANVPELPHAPELPANETVSQTAVVETMPAVAVAPQTPALVIEDDFDASLIFSKALQAAGHQVEVIRAGDLALKRLGEMVPHLVILDLHLPEVDGTEILKQIRADERLARTRVIIVTADARMAEPIKDDADLVLLKPASYSQVRDFALRLSRRS